MIISMLGRAEPGWGWSARGVGFLEYKGGRPDLVAVCEYLHSVGATL